MHLTPLQGYNFKIAHLAISLKFLKSCHQNNTNIGLAKLIKQIQTCA